MKTKATLVVLLMLAALIGVAVLLGGVKSEPETETIIQPEPVSREVNEPEIGVGTLADLQARKQTLECSITYRDSEMTEPVEGTFFTRNEMVRADFVQEDSTLGQVLTSYVVRDGQVYVWSIIDGQAYGVTAAVDASDTVSTPVPADETVRYNCAPWTRVDDSIFELPANVLFSDAAEAAGEFGTIYPETGEF